MSGRLPPGDPAHAVFISCQMLSPNNPVIPCGPTTQTAPWDPHLPYLLAPCLTPEGNKKTHSPPRSVQHRPRPPLLPPLRSFSSLSFAAPTRRSRPLLLSLLTYMSGKGWEVREGWLQPMIKKKKKWPRLCCVSCTEWNISALFLISYRRICFTGKYCFPESRYVHGEMHFRQQSCFRNPEFGSGLFVQESSSWILLTGIK